MSKPRREGSPSAVTFMARSIHGIESILAAEVRGRLDDADLLAVTHRTVEFRTPSLPNASELHLGCADDVFLHLGDTGAIDHTAKSVAALASAAAKLRFDDALVTIGQLRGEPLPSRFTVVASLLGRRNYNRYKVEDAVGTIIASSTGLAYESSRDGSPDRPVLTFRVHLTEDRATWALRLFSDPLHRRAYKTRSFEGTLHPPLAHAIAMLAGIRPSQSVLDPFCGAGTILVEAASIEPLARYAGFDIAPDRVSGALENARSAGANVDVTKGDAGDLPVESASVDRVITNPPWGIGVGFQGELEAGPSQFFAELSRVLRPEGRGVLLVHASAPEAVSLPPKLRRLLRLPVSLFGQRPEIWVVGSSAGSDRSPFDLSAPFGAELLENVREG